MEPQRLTGPDAGALKYDLLTALSVAGLNGSQSLQTSMLRLVALVTARYNWRADELSVGQRDMARMWSVNERTVKREIKRLVDTGILICKRGGVRGRVGAYRLNYTRIAELSEPSWALVGPDFEARMKERHRSEGPKVVQLSTYAKPVPTSETERAGTWGRAMARLASEQSSIYNAWYARLNFLGYDRGVLTVQAPSSFVQRYIETHLLRPLVDAVEAELGPIDRLEFK